MSLIWLAPIAFAGLILLAVPILIHLLTRQERREVPFPSLRFLKPTRFTALKRRIIDDWLLLLLRVAVIACAVAALASPLLITASRERQWASRVSRAIVTSGTTPLTDEEPAFASATFALGEPAVDALQAAVSWLNAQPISSREIVFAGDLRASAISEADLAVVPANIGVRFLPAAEPERTREAIVPVLRKGDDGAAAGGIRVHVEDARTVVNVDSPAAGAESGVLSVRAAAEDRAGAEAALRAVLVEQVVLDQEARRRVVVAWQGADLRDLGPPIVPPTLEWIPPALERLARPAQQHGDALVVRLPSRPMDEQAAVELRQIARGVFADSRAALEPRRLTPSELARWSRPAGPPAPNARHVDHGDRRFVWALALLFLAIEHAWRRRRRAATVASSDHEEARVA